MQTIVVLVFVIRVDPFRSAARWGSPAGHECCSVRSSGGCGVRGPQPVAPRVVVVVAAAAVHGESSPPTSLGSRSGRRLHWCRPGGDVGLWDDGSLPPVSMVVIGDLTAGVGAWRPPPPCGGRGGGAVGRGGRRSRLAHTSPRYAVAAHLGRLLLQLTVHAPPPRCLGQKSVEPAERQREACLCGCISSRARGSLHGRIHLPPCLLVKLERLGHLGQSTVAGYVPGRARPARTPPSVSETPSTVSDAQTPPDQLQPS